MFIYSKDSKYHLTSELLSLQSFKRTFTLPSQALRDLYHEICERARRPSGGVLQMEMVVVLPNPFVDTRFLSPAAESKKNVFFFFREDWEGKRKPATLKVHIFFVLHTEISSSLRLSFSRKREWILGANPSKKADLENGTWISDKPW